VLLSLFSLKPPTEKHFRAVGVLFFVWFLVVGLVGFGGVFLVLFFGLVVVVGFCF
jgi:hypothetical protein